jgi:tetratricopeptide (TPR) repeat protein
MTHYNVGIIHYRKGHLEEAVKAYQTAIKFKPDLAVAYNILGEIYVKQGRLEQAYKEFQTALKIDPNHKDARTNLEALDRIMKNR